MDEYTINVTPRSRFSKREIGDIAVAVITLSIAFMLLYRSESIGSFMWYLDLEYGDVAKWLILFATCFALVFFSFLLHEFGHKFTAQNFGMRSEFRMSVPGLFLTLITSMLGFLFAAPGAVVIEGYPDKKTNGLISIAGPAVNIVLSFVGIIGCLVFNHSAMVFVFLMFANLNAFLAFFNLLPIPPLDGSKIVTWNLPIYIVAIAVAVLELAYIHLWMPDLFFA